jgi:hypothetical protein
MNRITTTADRVVRSAEERKPSVGQRRETKGNRLVVRWRRVDNVIVTNAAPNSR